MVFQIPSPIQQINDPLFVQKGLSVFVKRDDLIHPQISGNKWRKLKYSIQKAELENKTHLVTFGGAFSNHLLATAAAAMHLGLKCTGIVRGEPVENETLIQCRAMGMNLIFIDRETYRDKSGYFEHHFQNDNQAYFINEGGASAEAVWGCEELITELPETFDHLFCSAGTGTTAAGIFSGIKKQNLKTRLHVIPALKDGGFLREEIAVYTTVNEQLTFHLNYHFGGYAKSNRALLQFIVNFYLNNQILLDPVYTGKLVFGLYDLIKNDQFEKGAKILWIHTGGLLGLLGMQQKFEEISPGFGQIFEHLKKNNF
ncbi:MAG: 1-aminocyclopropane-1-carboxylate deaminase/D-cysteine desulfhydrase [Sphingobacteriaceae bacterium]